MMALDEIGAPFSIGTLEVEATNLTSYTAPCMSDCRNLLVTKLAITLTDKVVSLKQSSLLRTVVIEIKFGYLRGCLRRGDRAQRDSDGRHPGGICEELFQHRRVVMVSVCRDTTVFRMLRGNVDRLARDTVGIPKGWATQLRWVYGEPLQEVGQLDDGWVSVIERAPVVLSDEIARQHDLVAGPRRVGCGYYET